MQTPEALSIGTATNLKAASETLLKNFDAISKDKKQITVAELRAGLRPQPVDKRDELQNAIRFFLVTPIGRRLAGEKPGTGMTSAGLGSAAKAAADPKLDELLLSWGDQKNPASSHFEEVLLRDPGVPDTVRKDLLKHFTDQRLIEIVGHPNVPGTNERDKKDIATAFVFLIRLSWLGAAEAEAIVRYKVPYAIMRGDKDKGGSYWNWHNVGLSETMIAGKRNGPVDPQELVQHIGTFAHESGHAIYFLSGMEKKFEADMARRGISKTPRTGLDGIVNEGIAGVFQNRANVAAQGYGKHKDTDDHLSLDADVEHNLVDDKSFYAKAYNVDTRQGRAELPALRQVVANDLIPWFETNFGLLDDPQLGLKLPPRGLNEPKQRR